MAARYNKSFLYHFHTTRPSTIAFFNWTDTILSYEELCFFLQTEKFDNRNHKIQSQGVAPSTTNIVPQVKNFLFTHDFIQTIVFEAHVKTFSSCKIFTSSEIYEGTYQNHTVSLTVNILS